MTRITLTHELGGHKAGDTIDVTPGVADQLIAGEYATVVGGEPRDDDQGDTKPAKNASLEAWKDYAEGLDIEVDDDATRADVIALVEAYETA